MAQFNLEIGARFGPDWWAVKRCDFEAGAGSWPEMPRLAAAVAIWRAAIEGVVNRDTCAAGVAVPGVVAFADSDGGDD